MEISIAEADRIIEQLVDRAIGGEEVVLTRQGRPVARLVPTQHRPSPEERQAVLDEVRASGRQNATPGPGGARSQDFLYSTLGRPE